MSSNGFLCGIGNDYSCLTANFSSVIYSNYASDLKDLTLPRTKETVAPINFHFTFHMSGNSIDYANDKDLNNSSKDLTLSWYTNKSGDCNAYVKRITR